jgi:alkylation response protein AidB-like acyl-CoA dehydrogenase
VAVPRAKSPYGWQYERARRELLREGRPCSLRIVCRRVRRTSGTRRRANRLACDAADRAMQTCGGIGYSRHMPFEHIYRHHRRYRITEGSEEIQMRKVGQELFGMGR